MAKTKKVTDTQFEDAVKDYVAAENELAQLEAKKQKAISTAESKYAEPIKELKEKIEETKATAEKYCVDNRDKVFGDAKSVDTGFGAKVSFRDTPAKLVYNDGVTPASLLTALALKRLNNYVQVKESVDVRKVVADAEERKLKKVLEDTGVRVEKGENFSIKLS